MASLSGCVSADPDDLPVFLPSTPHERYEFAFRQVGLETTALGYQWIDASRDALEEALPIEPPMSESGYFDPTEAPSLGYRISMRRGQRLVVNVGMPGTAHKVFIDLFRVRDGDTPQQFVHQVSADSSSASLEHIAGRDGEYVLRLQPELLTGGAYVLTVLHTASLAFPVTGHDTGAIRSGWGAARDGGRRRHEGVDIFARRGTPVIAALDGRVRSTRSSRLGGNVVWLRTSLGSLYYAHLDSVAVGRDSLVRVGDTVGFVGNTGNARTTPPHLHFGVYARGATDPYPFIYQPSQAPPRLTADTNLVGTTVRARESAVNVRRSPGQRGEVVRTLSADTPMHVLGGAGSWFRVRLPDRTKGFVFATSVESMHAPVEQQVVASTIRVLDNPNTEAFVVDSVPSGGDMPVLARYEGYVLVQAPSGRSGWVAEHALVAGAPPGGPD
jgi:murein DD-endopeptidase MepM/ murein hydrolase activator NlpD